MRVRAGARQVCESGRGSGDSRFATKRAGAFAAARDLFRRDCQFRAWFAKRAPRGAGACRHFSRCHGSGRMSNGKRQWNGGAGAKGCERRPGGQRALDKRNAKPYGYLLCVTVRLQIRRKRRFARWRTRRDGPCWTCCGKANCRRGKSRRRFQFRGRRSRSTCGCCGRRGWCVCSGPDGNDSSSSIPGHCKASINGSAGTAASGRTSSRT